MGDKEMKKMSFRICAVTVLLWNLTLSASAAGRLVPVGKVVGLSLTDGSVTVVAFDDELGGPAREAGIKIGDEILTVDGAAIDSAADLRAALTQSDGSITVTVSRESREHQLELMPAVSGDGPRLGVYVREGVTGIGTVTYYDPDSGTFGALGHGVSDQTGSLAQMERGQIYHATVLSVRKGECGKPGQLKGAVSSTEPMGELRTNCSFGVFGSCDPFGGEALPIGQAVEGDATILSNINGEDVESFTVRITKVSTPGTTPGRDLTLQVTDPALLNATGGIVAGMSGSPIIQDGKLVGAVTHVLVNDPSTGYGIFIENMLDAAA